MLFSRSLAACLNNLMGGDGGGVGLRDTAISFLITRIFFCKKKFWCENYMWMLFSLDVNIKFMCYTYACECDFF